MSVYDKAKWHFEGDFPPDLPQSRAYVHIGFFLGWAIERGWAGALLQEDFADDVAKFLRREITGPRLLEITDGVLDDQMLSTEGDEFAGDCYSDDFIRIYTDAFPQARTPYHVEDTWPNYERVRGRLDEFYERWKQKKK